MTDDNIDSHMFSAFSVAFDDALDIAEPGRGKSKPTMVLEGMGSVVGGGRFLLYQGAAAVVYRWWGDRFMTRCDGGVEGSDVRRRSFFVAW